MPKGGPPQVVDEHGSADFTRLMTVPRADDLIDSAFRSGRKAQSKKGAPGERGKNRELARVGAVSRSFESRLHRIIRSYPTLEDLHPFYRDLVDVILGVDDLRQHLGAVNWARQRVQEIRSDVEDRIRSSENDNEMMLARKEAYGRMASIVEQIDDDLKALAEARHELAGLPTIRFDAPVLVVAGYPNVGKSSFLRQVTRATPEVASYPFTTKGVSVGHREHRHMQVQVMDTPGLLDRPMEDRNTIERQAIEALRHAADAIVFLLDPSGHCGYPLDDQAHLLEELESEFPDVPVFVVENKADLETTGEHPAMSCETGDGIEEITEGALDLAHERFQERFEPSFSTEQGTGFD